MQWFLSAISALWQWWGREYISVKTASAYILLLSAIFYLAGSHRPQSAYNQLEKELADAKREMRLFANEIARRNGTVNNFRARNDLNKKTIDLLNKKIEALQRKNTLWQEQLTAYQHVLENKTNIGDDIFIHALQANPDFFRQEWIISAVLAHPGNRKKFQGSYYFEVIYAIGEGKHGLLRIPEEGTRKFEASLYQEIQESVTLSPGEVVEDLRIVILDKKGAQVATAEMGSLNDGNTINNDDAGELLSDES